MSDNVADLRPAPAGPTTTPQPGHNGQGGLEGRSGGSLVAVEELTLDHLSAPERSAWARHAWRESGGRLTDVELAERFERSPRWARDRIREARAEEASATVELPPATLGNPAPANPLPTADDGNRPAGARQPDDAPTAEPTAARQPKAKPASRRHAAPQPAGDDEQWWERASLAVGKLGVLLVAAALSYGHMRHVAQAAGEDAWAAACWPASVDGLLLVSMVTLRRCRRRGIPAGPAPWVGLGLSLLASLAANVASADTSWGGRFVAAWPPVALAVIEWAGKPRPAAEPAP